MSNNSTSVVIKIFRWLVVILILLAFILALSILAVRTPWAQQFITDKAVSFVSEKTGTKMDINKLFITFRGDVQLEGVFLEDLNKDTLIYLGELEAGVAFIPLIDGNVKVSRVNWNGLVANVQRSADSTFNFDFLIDAFANEDNSEVDTAKSEPPEITLGPINFQDFTLAYRDELIGMDAHLNLGILNLDMDNLDFEQMRFEIDDLALKNVKGKVTQWLPTVTTTEEDTASFQLPFLSANSLTFENIDLSYSASIDGLYTGMNLDRLTLSEAEIDLQKQAIELDEFVLENTALLAHFPKSKKPDTITSTEPMLFVWPDWKVAVNKLSLSNNSVELKIGKPKETLQQFNVSDVRLLGLNLLVEDVNFAKEKAELNLDQLSFSEKSGFELDKLAFVISVNDQELIVSELILETPNNALLTTAKLQYGSVQEIIDNPLNSYFEVDLAETNLSIEDAYYFVPQLRTDTLLRQICSRPINLSGFVSGRMEDITISDLRLSALNSLKLSLNAEVTGLLDTSSLQINAPSLAVSITRKDLTYFLSEEEVKSIPESIRLRGNVAGGVKKLLANFNIKTDAGNLNLNMHANNVLSKPSAKGKLELMQFDANKLASIPDLAPVSLKLDFDVEGNSIETVIANASVQFQELVFKNYDYSNVQLSAFVSEKKADVSINHTDENLDFNLKIDALLDTINPSVDLVLNLIGANLYKLGLSTEKVNFGSTASVSYAGPPSNFESSLSMEKSTLIKGNDVYRLKPVNVLLNNAANSTKLTVASEIINGKLYANASLDTLVGSITNYVQKLMSSDSVAADFTNDSLDIEAHFAISNSRVLTEAIVPKLERLDTIHLDLEFHPKEEKIALNLTAPKVIYADYLLDSLGLNASANGEVLKGALAFKNVTGGLVDVNRTRVDFGFQDKVATVDLSVSDSVNYPLAAVGFEVDMNSSNKELHLKPNGFLLNGEKWSVPAENKVSFQQDGVVFQAMQLSNAGQMVRLENLKAGKKNGMKVGFDGFELSSITSIVNHTDSFVDGSLNGTFRLLNLDKEPGIDADIRINDLSVLGVDLGQLKLMANNKNSGAYTVDFSVVGEPIDLAVKGEIKTEGELALDAKMDLNRFDIKVAEQFIEGQAENMSGFVQAHSTVSGPLNNLTYSGYLAFDDTRFTLSQLNTSFTLSKDRIDINNQGLVVKNFSLLGENGKKLSVDGTVKTSSLLNPKFNLSIVANNFQPLNSTREDSDLFYGKAFIDLDIDVKGSLSLPKVTAKAKLQKGTDVVFIVPESQAAIEERKGLVRFKNMKDTMNSILQVDEVVETSLFEGIDLIGYLEIDPSTQFKIILDERSGDNIQIQGEAKLNVEVTPNGITTLSGDYEVVGGSYDMKFYGITRRKFDLVSGSRIAWSGDPLTGELDLQAKYEVKTSASDLMADQLAQSDASTQNQYRQALPFEVMLNIKGELLKPEISFGMDMPESARQALNGNVYKRIRQLNETQSDLEKQVFSLIVLGRFLPQNFDGGDGSGSEKLARSSVSKLLSSQLNKYSSKYLKGVEVNFDLNSYTDYQNGSAQGRTELGLNVRKALFNNRLVVQVGGQVDLEGRNKNAGVNDILGDLSLEYLITEEGQYRLKAFRKNEFQDLVQGQVVVTGLSLLFNKSYNNWKDLFSKNQEKSKAKEEEKSETKEEILEP